MEQIILYQKRERYVIWKAIRATTLRSAAWLVLLVLTCLATTALGFLPAALTRDLIDRAIPRGDLNLILVLAILIAVVPVLSSVATSIDQFARLKLLQAVQSELQTAVTRAFLEAPLDVALHTMPGDLLTTVGSDCSIIIQHCLNIGIAILQSALGLAISIWLLLEASPWLLLVSGVIALSKLPLQQMKAAILRKRNQVQQDAQSAVSSLLVESVSGVRTLKAYLQEEKRASAFLGYVRAIFSCYIPLECRVQGLNVLEAFVSGLVPAAVYGYGGFLVVTGKSTLGTVLAILQYISRGTAAVTGVTASLTQLKPLGAYAERVVRFLELPKERQGGVTPAGPSINLIEVRAVSFRYRNGREVLLSGVNLRLERGKTIALHGPSGSGKTTLAYLISGFLTPTSGSITVDGIDLGLIDPAWYRRHVCLVTDSEMVFQGTIRDNLLIAKPDASQDEICRCLHFSTLQEAIAELPKGLDTVIGPNGSGISSGQRQRLCLARAILYDPDVLILDEVSANLDLNTERIMMERLSQLFHSKAVLLIAHRESMLQWASEVYSLQDGTLVPEHTK